MYLSYLSYLSYLTHGRVRPRRSESASLTPPRISCFSMTGRAARSYAASMRAAALWLASVPDPDRNLESARVRAA
jgi:hypothetical protein